MIEKSMLTGPGIIITIGVILVLSAFAVRHKLDDKIVDEKTYPVVACDYILNNIDIKNMRIFNEYNYGSYMLFRGIPVFIDSRADLYSPEFNGWPHYDVFSDFLNISGIGDFYEDVFEKYGITHVICYRNSKLNLIIIKAHDYNYNEIYVDDNFIIYERLTANSKEKNESNENTIQESNTVMEDENAESNSN